MTGRQDRKICDVGTLLLASGFIFLASSVTRASPPPEPPSLKLDARPLHQVALTMMVPRSGWRSFTTTKKGRWQLWPKWRAAQHRTNMRSDHDWTSRS